MLSETNLNRFLDAQQHVYFRALTEIQNGKKETHWMWFIFPQIKGLGRSETAEFYAIQDIQEATEYLHHPVLGKRLIEITAELLRLENTNAHDIFGAPDDMKLRSSMTLFAQVRNAHPFFEQVIERYFDGIPDQHTLDHLHIH